MLNLKDEPTRDLRKELISHVQAKIGPLATPADTHFVGALPKTRSGKIMRRVIESIADGEQVGDLTSPEDIKAVEEIINIVYPRE